MSLLQIRQPQMIHNNIIVENSRDDETTEGAGDTLARAMPGDTEDNRRFSSQRNGPIETDVSVIDNEILKLFPERVIKVSSFIDLLGSQLTETTCNSTTNQSLSKSGSQNFIRLRNPIRKLAADVDFA